MKQLRQHHTNCWTAPIALILPMCIANVSTAQSTSDSIKDEVSYTNEIRPIVNNFCTTCHAGDDPEGEFVLTCYDDVRKHVEKGDLLKRINDAKDPMPQSGLLPKYMRRLFQVWADNGYVNQGKTKRGQAKPDYGKFEPPKITPVDINEKGFDLLKNMQGHWVGSMKLMGQQFDWFAFDYRAIAPSHVHGIFEAGTLGNLFTSFFVTNFNGKRTIMARNGGILNGIYRTSYFVLDKVEYGRNGSYYRLVDAYGGKDIMWMELIFYGNQIEFNSYTSRFGLITPPKLHMSFKAKRMHSELAAQAAKAVGFPKNVVDFDLSKGLPKPNWSEDVPQTSASYIWEEKGKSLIELGKIAKDPYRIDQMPYLAKLSVEIHKSALTKDKKLHLYLSNRPLTDERGKFITQFGYIREDLLDGLLAFPEISSKENQFTFTYLHPGKYFLTVIADMDADGYPSPGDITHSRTQVVVKPKSNTKVVIKNLNVRN